MPKISVIVPIYKVEKYICPCIDSILAQTFTDFELILIDDGSPDKCGEICEDYAKNDPRIHVIHQENSGPSTARNKGIDWAFANSDSEWLAFIDSDDWVHPEFLQLLYKATSSLNIDLSICNYLKTDKQVETHTSPSINTFKKYSIFSIPEKFWHLVTVTPCAKLFRKTLFKEIRFPLNINCGEDVATIYKAVFSCDEIAISSKALYYYRQNQESIMHSAWTPSRLNALEAYQKQFHFFKNKNLKEAMKMSKISYIETIYDNLILARKEPEKYHDIIYKLVISLKSELINFRGMTDFNYYNAAVYYKEIYPTLNPIWNLFIFIRVMKTEGWEGIKQRIKARLKCQKSL